MSQLLPTVKYSENEREITFECPICRESNIVTRVKSDPKGALYVLSVCGDCQGDKGSFGLIFYDKYGHVLKIEESPEDEDD